MINWTPICECRVDITEACYDEVGYIMLLLKKVDVFLGLVLHAIVKRKRERKTITLISNHNFQLRLRDLIMTIYVLPRC